MGFFGLIRSIEDLLYEVMTWLVFYPRTLLRVLRHPQEMIDYSDREQDDAVEEQYTDTLSPPVFLILSILICHGVELALGQKSGSANGVFSKLFANSEETLLAFRLLVFSIYPMVYAVGMVKRSEAPLDRKTLREPFFSQCYLGALFAILVSGAGILMRTGTVQAFAAGAGVLVIGIVWYLALQTVWLHLHLTISRTRAILVSLATFLKGTFYVGLIISLLSA
ncbi:hypothetical protein [Novosphingobium sp.]|uniref:hypothetical protein n=1 Tax=Novosphingobium sp. TaxID=1874826 RepID=UPI0025F0E7F9|nr:hypothetical protein [Novosphingobium sp.]